MLSSPPQRGLWHENKQVHLEFLVIRGRIQEMPSKHGRGRDEFLWLEGAGRAEIHSKGVHILTKEDQPGHSWGRVPGTVPEGRSLMGWEPRVGQECPHKTHKMPHCKRPWQPSLQPPCDQMGPQNQHRVPFESGTGYGCSDDTYSFT